jgi:curved DNA-binding protein
MEFKDYYGILGISKTASDDEIKRAYRKLARKHHPDLNPGDKAAEAKFKEINEANEVLGDPDKRRKYDELGANWRAYEGGGARPDTRWESGPGTGYRTMTPEEVQQMFGGSADPFSDFFHTFFGGAGGGRATGGQAHRARPAPAAEAIAELTLEEAFNGTTRRIVLSGVGAAKFADGEQKMEVRIPAGVKEGSRVRAGDVFLIVHLLPHPKFEVRDRDLYTRFSIPITTAVLGGDASVPTLSGSTLRLKVPELTPAGRVFRLRGHGMPAVGKPDQRGDLYVTLEVAVPAAISPEERKHFEALQSLSGGSKPQDKA